MRVRRLRMSLTIVSSTADASWTFELKCRQVNVAGVIDARANCEFRSVIRFLQVEGCFVEGDHYSCCFPDFTTNAKSHSDF
ncbi:hypothetical protein AVEN_256351-1 [Araneus ventricosus]|uniref:Uncharacterized protein n=1 Tax=Araneus ventricosus TaxID=182803 RepID=A0A4Y2SUV5_ARAVE|nr:hypothetical protein AVEN_254858-1 [Araneus ventricosus]GBN93611.1 hypothetical protein AVEN_102958-1 [Araneus ventricosus]GBN93612.1 hypothetical protein AVEN_256351-1 [Araneus ventricosus]